MENTPSNGCIMVEVNCVIKDKEGDVVTVHGKEVYLSHPPTQMVWTANGIFRKSSDGIAHISKSFYVKDTNGHTIPIDYKKKANKICLVAYDANKVDILSSLPTCHEHLEK